MSASISTQPGADENEHVFTKEELEACADGECSNCDRCCTVFPLTLPADAATDMSTTFRKEMGVVCPLLAKDGQGCSTCTVHQYKQTHPDLERCADFSGTEGRYAELLEEIEHWITNPTSAEQVQIIQEWLRTGRLSDIEAIFDDQNNIAIAIASYVVELGIIPEDFFDHYKLREAIASIDSDETRNRILYQLGDLKPGTALHDEFIGKYVS